MIDQANLLQSKIFLPSKFPKGSILNNPNQIFIVKPIEKINDGNRKFNPKKIIAKM